MTAIIYDVEAPDVEAEILRINYVNTMGSYNTGKESKGDYEGLE